MWRGDYHTKAEHPCAWRWCANAASRVATRREVRSVPNCSFPPCAGHQVPIDVHRHHDEAVPEGGLHHLRVLSCRQHQRGERVPLSCFEYSMARRLPGRCQRPANKAALTRPVRAPTMRVVCGTHISDSRLTGARSSRIVLACRKPLFCWPDEGLDGYRDSGGEGRAHALPVA